VGFRSVGVEHERPERFAGDSKARSIHVTQLAVKAVFAHSWVPLVVIPVIGIGLFLASILALLALVIDWLVAGVPFPGFGTIVALMVMLFGVLFCLLGVVSIYVGLIYEEVKGRPNFIVRRRIGFVDSVENGHLGGSIKNGQPYPTPHSITTPDRSAYSEVPVGDGESELPASGL
jgi:polyisoprenyl-phosphate glycosyltransferase